MKVDGEAREKRLQSHGFVLWVSNTNLDSQARFAMFSKQTNNTILIVCDSDRICIITNARYLLIHFKWFLISFNGMVVDD